MKHIIKSGILCALTFAVGAVSAQARGGHHDEALAALGGFIGGVIVSEAVHNHNRSCGPNYAASYEYRNDRSHGHGHGYHQDYVHGRDRGYHDGRGRGDACGCGGGYWKIVERKVWVPASISVKISSCGTRIRYREPGYWKITKDRVWVNGHARGCRGH